MKRRISTSILQGNWKKLWNMTVTIIKIVIGAFGTVTKGLIKGLEDLEVGGVETIQITTLLRMARILRRVLETWQDLLSLKLLWKTHQLTMMWKTQITITYTITIIILLRKSLISFIWLICGTQTGSTTPGQVLVAYLLKCRDFYFEVSEIELHLGKRWFSD